MKIEFTKMHGLGNDFMVINQVTQNIQLNANQIRRLAEKEAALKESARHLAELEAAAAARARIEARARAAETERLRAEGETARADRDAARAEAAELASELARVLGSRSYRITAPLRRLRALPGGGAGG